MMPDPAPAPQTLLQQIRDVLLALAAVISALGVPVGIFMANRNSTKIEQVEVRQVEAVEKADEVKADLDKKAAEERQAKIVNLLGTWKWLEEVAAQSGLPADKAAAEKARRVYDEFKRQNGN